MLLSGYQALIFAPTELLAEQHYRTLYGLAEQLPLGQRPNIGLLVGSSSKAEKTKVKNGIASGHISIIISTQAALWVKEWHNLALVVIDEQHK